MPMLAFGSMLLGRPAHEGGNINVICIYKLDIHFSPHPTVLTFKLDALTNPAIGLIFFPLYLLLASDNWIHKF
jgi:hypothetical protein